MEILAFLFLTIDRFFKQNALEEKVLTQTTVNSNLLFFFNAGPTVGYILSLCVFGVLCVILGYLWKSFDVGARKRIGASYILLIGGGASNIFDRVFYGGAIDMFSIPGLTLFNLADIALLVGAVLLVGEVWHQRYIQARS